MNGLTDTPEIFEEIVKHAVTQLTHLLVHLNKKSLSNGTHRHEFFYHCPVASAHKFLYLEKCLHFIYGYIYGDGYIYIYGSMDFYCAKVT